MKIDATLRRGCDVEVDIDFDDFMEQAFAGRDDENSNLERINKIGGLLNRIPDKAIEGMNPNQREIVAKFLAKQSARFEEKAPA